VKGARSFAPNNPGRSKASIASTGETRCSRVMTTTEGASGRYVRTPSRACVAAALVARVKAGSRLEPVGRCSRGDRRQPEVGRVRLGLGQPSKAARRVQRSTHGNVLAETRGRAEVIPAEAGERLITTLTAGLLAARTAWGHVAAPTLDDGAQCGLRNPALRRFAVGSAHRTSLVACERPITRSGIAAATHAR